MRIASLATVANLSSNKEADRIRILLGVNNTLAIDGSS